MVKNTIGRGQCLYSAALPELDGHLANVEVDEVLRLVGDERTEGTPDNAVPCRIVLLIELLLDVGGDVLLDVEAIESLSGNVDGVGLHLVRHVDVLHDSAAILCHVK